MPSKRSRSSKPDGFGGGTPWLSGLARRSSFPSPVFFPLAQLVFRRMIDKEGRAKHSLWQQVNIGTVPEIEVKMGQGEMVYRCTFSSAQKSLPSFAFRNMLHFETNQKNILAECCAGRLRWT